MQGILVPWIAHQVTNFPLIATYDCPTIAPDRPLMTARSRWDLAPLIAQRPMINVNECLLHHRLW